MGKRRKEGPHADKYTGFNNDDDDSDEVEQENNLEKEPLKPEEILNIKSRKKLIATRRVTTNGNGNLTTANVPSFTPFSTFNSAPAIETTTENKPSVFSGFKGFVAFKPSIPVTTTTTTPVTTNGVDTSKPTETKTINSFLSSFNPNFSDSSSSSSLFNTKTNTEEKSTAPVVPTLNNLFNQSKPSDNNGNPSNNVTKQAEVIATNSNQSNICETELNFMNDLNDLYERYYGNTKRNYSIPSDALNGDYFEIESEDEKEGKNTNEENQKDESKKKYAYLLAELNKHCSKWISKHVEENPLVILTPVFVDYFAYLILLEKNFFPSTFKKESVNNITKPVNGVSTTNVASSFLKFNTTNANGTTGESPSLFLQSQNTSLVNSTNKNGFDTENHKHLNGLKFGVTQTTKEAENHATIINGSATKEKTQEEKKEEKENENKESENDKNLETSSKTFASFMKNQTPQFNPISLSSSGSLLFKPTVSVSESLETNKGLLKTEFSSPSLPTKPAESSLFKFGIISTSTSSIATTTPSLAATSSDNKTQLETNATLPKTNLFSTSSTPTFKFGDISKSTISPSTTSQSSSSTLFSKPAETATENQPPASTAGGFFKNLSSTNSLTNTTNTTANPPAVTFPSLSNSSTNSSIGVFKSFTNPESAQPPSSIFSLATNSSSTSIFNFPTNQASKPSIFGLNPTFGKSDNSNATSIFSTNIAANTNEGGEADEEEYEPPKPEVSDVKEDGAVFNKRIKLYYFNDKDQKFCDRGIGNLYIKPINGGDSTQLIIRADNTLANILLNVKLNKLFPITKIGAKDVSYICVPNPPIPNTDAKVPCKFLFKVKTEDDAKELLEKLNEFKK